MFADNMSYREYQQLLVELHRMIADGRNQSPEAAKLRQRMERVEANLSEDEIVRLNALSADLSMIHDREIPEPEVSSRISRDDIPRRMKLTFEQRKWEDVLELLRADVSQLWPAAQIAYVRSRAYEGLGELAPAIAFMDEAARRAPKNANYRALALRLLWEDNQYQEAFLRARDYLADQAVGPRLVLMSGGIVAQQSMSTPEPADIQDIAGLAIERIRQALPSEASPNLIFAGLVSLGLLAIQTDDMSGAINALREASKVDTSSDQQVTASWALNKELEMLQSGKIKTVEERSNALRLAEGISPSTMAVAV